MSSPDLMTLCAVSVGLGLLYILGTIIYNLYFHPLRSFPAPLFNRVSPIPWMWAAFHGNGVAKLQEWHDKYGEFVRMAPNELSIINENSWSDIFMHKQGRPQFSKSRRENPARAGVYHIINAPNEVHARQRKMLAHAFSDRALREQEPVLKMYIDKLFANLHADAENKIPTDVVSFFNYTTFDIMADLYLGASFENLDQRRAHPWLTGVFVFLKKNHFFHNMVYFPLLRKVVWGIVTAMGANRGNLENYTQKAVTKRLSEDRYADRNDFMTKILPHKREDGTGISEKELYALSDVLIIAGSETTATFMSGASYYLSLPENKRVVDKLREELNSATDNGSQITLKTVSGLPYLHAVTEEALRLYPPVPGALARITPPEGASIGGKWVAGNTAVGIPQRIAYRSPTNFAEPLSFIPERWLPDRDGGRFAKDRHGIFQPFSAGPRNCLGKNLAYAEMRLMLARMVMEFDFEMVDKSLKWDEQKVYSLYEKIPLKMQFKNREIHA